MDMKLKVAEYIAQAAQQSFENCASRLGNDVSAMIETPPDKKMGDYALPCFRLSKTMRCAPQMIAGKLAEKIACEEIDHVEVVGGYLNVFLRRGGLARDIVEAVLKNPGRWGSSEIGKRQDGVPGLFLHQHCQAFPHRPSVHDDDRQQPQAHL